MARAGRAGGAASGREALAAADAASGENLAAADGGHAGAEAVTALAHEFGGLISPLHGDAPVRLFAFWGRVAEGPDATIWKNFALAVPVRFNGKNDPGAKPKIASGLIGAGPEKSQREAPEFGAADNLCLLPSRDEAAKHRATVAGPTSPAT
jgi:hypothetical protein